MKHKLLAKCEKCGSYFNESLIDSNCPFCETTLGYKQVNDNDNIISYFSPNLPKLNNPKDYIYPIHNNKIEPIRNKRKYNSNHYINIIPFYYIINGRKIVTKLGFTWDFNYKEIYSIYQSSDENHFMDFYIDTTLLKNILTEKDDLFIDIYTLVVPKESYEKFLNIIRDNSHMVNLSSYNQLYNTINWDILDDSYNVKKTFYEYSSINYLLNLFQLIKVPTIFKNFEEKLINIDELKNNLFVTTERTNLKDFIIDNDIENSHKDFLNESINFLIENDINNYEDIYDYYTSIEEGAVAPNAIPLSAVAQRSSEVYSKLYDLGYNPSLNIYSSENKTSLCPTFSYNNSIYYIECNNNIMNGINVFDNLKDMKETLEEVYNENNSDSIFISINHIPSDVLKFNVNNSKNNKEFLTKLIDLRDKYIEKPDYNYEYTVQDEFEDSQSKLNSLRKMEITSSVLFKYSNNYKIRRVQWSGNKYGYIYLDSNDNVAAYIIGETIPNDFKIYSDIPKDYIDEIIELEVMSDFKKDNLELDMIKDIKKLHSIDTIKVRNINLIEKINNNENYKEIDNHYGTHIYRISDRSFNNLDETISLNEAINATKRNKIEKEIYKVFDLLDPTGINTKKYKELFSNMNDTKFDNYMKEFFRNKKQNFYLECLPNKNAPKIKNAKDALDYLKVPTEEYLYYRHDGNQDNPLRTRYKVPIIYVQIKRVQQMLSKKNTFSLNINKRNLKTG